MQLVQATAQTLADLGATHAFGVSGAAIGRFADALIRAGLCVVHPRHEGGAAFMACEASLATGRPQVVFTTTGPGFTNAITGLVAAAWEGATVVAVVGGTDRKRLGRGAFQETGPEVLDLSRWLPPGLPRHVAVVDQSSDLAEVAEAIAGRGAGGLLVVLQLPTDTQMAAAHVAPVPAPLPPEVVASALVDRCAHLLRGARPVIWAGFGSRAAYLGVRRLAERLGCPVITTPRAAGVISATDPLWAGGSGFGGSDSLHARMAEYAPDVGLVLGSRLGEFATFWQAQHVPSKGWIHVDVDSTAFGRAYPEAKTIGVCARVGPFIEALLKRDLGPPGGFQTQVEAVEVPRAEQGLHPAEVMAVLQQVVVERSDATVISEAGNAFAWATHALRFDRPRYRVSTSFGAMGQASAGSLGCALATGPTVAVLGDGAMLMNTEINTAVAHSAPVVWVVLNDAAYGMIAHGMRAIGLDPVLTSIPRVDFAAFARSQGATGCAVESPEALATALRTALAHAGPTVIDVRVDPSVPPPFGQRNVDLRARAAWEG